VRELKRWDAVSQKQKARLSLAGSASWTANINPGSYDHLIHCLRSFLVSYYCPIEKSAFQPIPRWGFKEVRYDFSVAMLLLELFPLSKIVFLIRNPRDQLASNAGTEWYREVGGAEGLARQWMHIATSFAGNENDRIITVKYEDLLSDTEATTERLGSHLDIPPERFERATLDIKVRGWAGPPHFGPQESAALERFVSKDLLRYYKFK
jgi:hypothetical protein